MIPRPNPPGVVQSMYNQAPAKLFECIQKDFPRSRTVLDGTILVLRGDGVLPTKIKPKEGETAEETTLRLAKARAQSIKSRESDDNELDVQIKVENSFGYPVYTLKATMRAESTDRKFHLVERYEAIVPSYGFLISCMNTFENKLVEMRKRLVNAQKTGDCIPSRGPRR